MGFLYKLKSRDADLPESSHPTLLIVSNLATELMLVAACWYAIDALIYLRLSPPGFVATYATWVLTWLLARWGRWYFPLSFGGWTALELILPAVFLILITPHLRHPLTVGEVLFASGWMWGVCQFWRRWFIPPGVEPIQELFRRLLVIVIPYGLMFPFITDLELGGVDARWYANMLTDFILQSRAGVFPVFIGQGFHAYNGAIHPFRSAPMFMWTSGIWDLVTFRSLPIYSLQHLTAVSTAIFAAVAMYLALTGLRWRNRCAAFCFSILFISAPAILEVLYCSEMYMTWTAIACMPMVMYANGRILLRADRKGWVALGVGLSLIWMSHPPVALIVTMVSAFIQLIATTHRKIDGALLRKIAWSGVTFCLLSGYYFISMSEVPSRTDTILVFDALQVVGIMLVTVAALRAFYRSEWIWLCALLPAGWLFYRFNAIWLAWCGGFLLSTAGARAVNRGPFDAQKKSASTAASFAGILVGGAVAWLVAEKSLLAGNPSGLDLLEKYADVRVAFFAPITRDLIYISDFQPGLSVWLSLAFALFGLYTGRFYVAGLFASAGAVIFCLFFRVPWVSDFLVGFAPMNLASIVSLPLTLRLLPPCIALICTAGFLTWCSLQPRWNRASGVMGTIVAFALVGWSLWETRNIVARGRSLISSRVLTQRHLLSENIKLERFAYDLMPLPEYFSDGPTDPRLENRLLNLRQQIIFGEAELANVMEKPAGTRQIRLVARENGADRNWLKLTPDITLAPGENLLLRFKFSDAANYTGVFIFSSDKGDYREYLLPNVGFSRAFGIDDTHPKLLSLWNSGPTPATYGFSLLKGEGNDLLDRSVFADITLSNFDEKSSDIELKSFTPYRARAKIAELGFLETPRVYLPGYSALVDGKPTVVMRSDQKLAMIPLQPGIHEVELKFRGTVKLWVAASISGVAWVSFLGLVLAKEFAAKNHRFLKRHSKA